MPSSKITSLLVDSRGVLWVGTDKGLSLLDKLNGNAINFIGLLNNNFLNGNIVSGIVETSDSNIFVSTHDRGLNKFNWKTGIIKKYKQPILIKKNAIIKSKNEVKNKVKIEVIDDEIRKLSISDISSICLIKNDLFVGSTAGLYKLDIKKNISQKIKFDSTASVASLTSDSSGTLWIGSEKGLFKYNGISTTICSEISLNQKSTLVLSLMTDKNGFIWLGTRGGAGFVKKNDINITTLKIPLSDSNSVVNYIIEGSKVFLGTNNGLNIVNYKLGGIDRINLSNDINNSGRNNVNTICELSNDSLLIGTENGLLNINLNSDKISSLFGMNNDSLNTFITSIFKSDNSILIGTKGKGVWKLDLGNNSLKSFLKSNYKDSNSISSDTIISISKSSLDEYWISSPFQINKTKSNFTTFKKYKFDKKIIGVVCLNDKIFCATTDGLFNYQRENDHFDKINIPASNLKSIYIDNKSTLYLSSETGCIEFETITGNSKLFESLIGNIYYKLNDGSKVLCGLSGNILMMIRGKETIQKNDFDIVITSFQIDSKEIHKELFNKDSIYLSYQDNSFNLEFTGLDFSGKAINFEYQLIGFDKDPIIVSDRRYISYTNIDPGNYQLYIKSIGNSKKFILTIKIESPIWTKWWFRSLIILVVFSLASLFYYLRLKNIRQKKVEAESRALQSELQALRLQMNPHFIFNSLNSIQSYITDNKQELASEYLALFARLIRKILDNSRKQAIPIAKEIETLEIYLTLERVRFDNQFDYKFDIDPNVDVHWLTIPPMLIQPYIENSIKHGLRPKSSGGTIIIGMKMIDEINMLCWIQDNGIGRKKALELKNQRLTSHKSIAMEATKDRLEILNSLRKQKVSVKVIDLYNNNEALGTKVELIIPIE
ncbi:MAG: histidine kinase [Chlorobiota bacterium]|nr:MAG: histidine kinase [Chlorobiota bacterium]